MTAALALVAAGMLLCGAAILLLVYGADRRA